MMRLLIAWLLLVAFAAPSVAREDFARADRPWTWSFPRDHGSHPEFQTEWWYFTGALEGDVGAEYGFELTFFRFALALQTAPDASDWRARDLILAHFTITDLDRGEFHLDEGLQRAAAGLAGADEDRLRVWKRDWEIRQEGETFVLRAGSTRSNLLELTLVPERDPVLHGENGLSWKSADRQQASYYYSIPRLKSDGRMTLDGKSFDVRGTTWMDHEFFTGDGPVQGVGWDWFSCRLEDGRDLMLYLLRYPDGTRYRSGTIVDADGSSRSLRTEEMILEPLRTWTSTETGTTYPVDWRIVLPAESLELEVRTRLDAQEVHAEETVGFAYWEGLSAYRGTLAGQPIAGDGYVELTGYE